MSRLYSTHSRLLHSSAEALPVADWIEENVQGWLKGSKSQKEIDPYDFASKVREAIKSIADYQWPVTMSLSFRDESDAANFRLFWG